MIKYTAILALVILAACKSEDNGDNDKPLDPSVVPAKTPEIKYSVVSEFPHDTSAYTQGLEFFGGKLYEGTGDFETSSLRITDFKTGKVLHKHMMGTNDIFGEGITVFDNKIYQLTWQSNLVYVYDVKNLDKPVKTFKWPYEGWGITHNSTELIISDGSSNLYFVNPDDFRLKSTLRITDNSGPVSALNELEYVDGFVFANVYQSDIIVKIDPASGQIVGQLNMSGLKEKFFANQLVPGRTDVLNGIAYDSTEQKLYITGKRWPKMFALKLQ